LQHTDFYVQVGGCRIATAFYYALQTEFTGYQLFGCSISQTRGLQTSFHKNCVLLHLLIKSQNNMEKLNVPFVPNFMLGVAGGLQYLGNWS